MHASTEAMKREHVPIAVRDYCAHLLIPLNRCRHSQKFGLHLPWHCQEEIHAYERCQYIEYVVLFVYGGFLCSCVAAGDLIILVMFCADDYERQNEKWKEMKNRKRFFFFLFSIYFFCQIFPLLSYGYFFLRKETGRTT